MADNTLVVNTSAQVTGTATPAMSQSNSASYVSGQTLNQTIVLRAGQQYAPNIGFSNLIIETTGPVQLLATRGSNPSFLNLTISQQTTLDQSVDSFTVTNNGTTTVTVRMLITVYIGNPLPSTGVVTSLDNMTGDIHMTAGPGIGIVDAAQTITINNTGVLTVNGQNGNVTLNANNLPGLAAVAISGEYSDLKNIPAPYVLPAATPTLLGGVKVGTGLSVTPDGTLSAAGFPANYVTSVNTLHGDVTIRASDNGAANSASLIVNDGSTTGNIILNRLAVSGPSLTMMSQNGVIILGSKNTIATVDGQAPDLDGNIVVKATDNPGIGGTSLIKDSGETTGNIVLNKLIAGQNMHITPDGNGNLTLDSTLNSYVLPVATTTTLGGVKKGANVNIAQDGTLSVAAPYVLPAATRTTLGGVAIGANLNIDVNGVLSAPNPYSLPTATSTRLGGVKIGSNITVAGDGTISVAAPYALPVATSSVLGGVKQGSNVTIAADGTLSVAAPYVLPIATASVLGGVKQGANITIAADGTISANATTRTSMTVVATADGQAVFTFPQVIPAAQADAYLVGTYLLYGYDYTSSGATVTLDPSVASKVSAGNQLVVNFVSTTPITDGVQASVLAGSGGAAMVGTTSGASVQQTIDSISSGSTTKALIAEDFGWPQLGEVAINNAIAEAVAMNIGVVKISTPGTVSAPIVFPLNFGVVIEGINQESLITVANGVAIDSVFTTPNFETLYSNQPGSSTNGVVRDCGLRHIAINGNKANVPAVTNWMKGMAIRCLWLRPILEDVSIWSTPGIGMISVYPSAGNFPPGYNFPANLQVDTKIRGIHGLYIHDTNYEGLIWEGPSDTVIDQLFVGWPSGSLDTGLYNSQKKSLKFTAGGIVNVNVLAGGVSYTAPTLTLTDPTGSGATLEARVVNGVITTIPVTNGGSGYVAARIAIVDSTGFGAAATATVVGGVITAVTVTASGFGYTNPSFVVTDISGPGTGAVLGTATLINGVIDRILVTSEGYGYTNPTLTITDTTGSGASTQVLIDNTCDGLVFNDQGAELGFIHSFNNVNGWAINFRNSTNGFPRITGKFIMGESSLGCVRIGGHTRYQVGNIDVHSAGTGGGPAGYGALMIRSDRGGVIGTVTDYRLQTATQGMPSVALSGTNNSISGGTVFGRGVTGDGVLIYGSSNEVKMTVTGVTGAAVVTDSSAFTSNKWSINSASNLLCWREKTGLNHLGSVYDIVNNHIGINQFVGINGISGRQWQDGRVISTDARGIIVGTKDVRFATADCTLTTTQTFVIQHNCVRIPSVNDVVLQIKENFGASMTLESLAFVSATGPTYAPSNPVIQQGTITISVKFRTAGTGTATIQVNII